MSDIVIDRNQRFDLIAKLAASGNGVSAPEQQAILNAIEVQSNHIEGDLALEIAARRAALSDDPVLLTPSLLAKTARGKITKRKAVRVKRALKRSR